MWFSYFNINFEWCMTPSNFSFIHFALYALFFLNTFSFSFNAKQNRAIQSAFLWGNLHYCSNRRLIIGSLGCSALWLCIFGIIKFWNTTLKKVLKHLNWNIGPVVVSWCLVLFLLYSKCQTDINNTPLTTVLFNHFPALKHHIIWQCWLVGHQLHLHKVWSLLAGL